MLMVSSAQDGFFYSYTYNLAATLQSNMEKGAAEAAPFDSMFVWNEFLTRCASQIRVRVMTVSLHVELFRCSRPC